MQHQDKGIRKPARYHRDDVTTLELFKMHSDGMNLTQISKKVGMSRQAISNRLDKAFASGSPKFVKKTVSISKELELPDHGKQFQLLDTIRANILDLSGFINLLKNAMAGDKEAVKALMQVTGGRKDSFGYYLKANETFVKVSAEMRKIAEVIYGIQAVREKEEIILSAIAQESPRLAQKIRKNLIQANGFDIDS